MYLSACTMRMNMGIRILVHGSCLVVALALMSNAESARAERLTISSWAGQYADSQREAYFGPFERETGIAILEDHWGGNLDKIRAMVATGHYRVHVLDGESRDLERACNEGLLEAVDYSSLGLSSEDFLGGALHRCGVGSVGMSMVLVHGQSTQQSASPAGWADFWDLTRYPGARGMRHGPQGNLEIALLADGVPPEAVYEVLQGETGVDRAFSKLDEIRHRIVWWESGRQPMRLLQDGDVAMSTAWHGRVVAQRAGERGNLNIVWHGQIVHFNYWMIPRGHPGAKLAHRFIELASRPQRQAAQTGSIPYGPLNLAGASLLDEEAATRIPTHPDNLTVWLKHDGWFWVENGPALKARFAAWLESGDSQ